MRTDSGLSIRQLATAAGIDNGFLSQIERGLREPSLAVLVATATALGGDVRLRVYPGTGPRVYDAIQARMIEALIGALDPRWTRYLEVPVYRPSRGVIDLVIHERRPTIVAVEAQSEIRRLEQQIRWSHEKADSLPSARIWPFPHPFPDPVPAVDRLLLLRNTNANRRIVRELANTFALEYPAPTSSAYAALTKPDGIWVGSAILWVTVDGTGARVLDHPPRGVEVGSG